MIKLRENKGILLVSTFLVATVITILSGAFVTSSLVQNQSVQRERAGLQSFYAAEKGIEYAFIESQNDGWNWRTHQVAGADLDGDGLINDLEAIASPPGVTLAGAAISTDPDSDCPGCYVIPTPSGNVSVKTYADPDDPNVTIALSRDINGPVFRVLRFRITRLSLYRYLYYYPADRTFNWMTFDGKGVGGIYVNGNIRLGSKAVFNRITELSTNENGSIFLVNSQYTPPYQLDNKRIWNGTAWSIRIDRKAPLPQIKAPYTYANNNGPPNIYTTRDGVFYPWSNGNWPSYVFPPKDWQKVDTHFEGYDSNPSYNPQVNGVTLPRRLATNWDWNKYSGPTTVPYSELPVKFVDENGQEPDATYWNNVANIYAGMGGESMFDPAFWNNNKTYQRTPATVQVNYLNTDKQAGDWQAWLENTENTGINLNGVVQEKNTGGYNTAIPNIQVSYSTLAQENGLYIGQDASGQREVYLNGQNLGNSLPTWVRDGVEFFNTVRPRDRNGDGTVDKENVLQLDISAIPPGETINNGIIYVASKNLRVVNATRLPESLTIVSPYNVYIKGDYNTDADWKPTAVITNSLVYLLSNSFNDPQTLPATLNPRENPNEQQYITLASPGPGFNREALINEIKSFFGLSNFDPTAPAPYNLRTLVQEIRSQYDTEYDTQKPNIAASTTYNLAVASPFEPAGYQLEIWGGATPTMKGAFLQLASSWVNDAAGNPIRDVLVNASGLPTTYNGKRTGGPNAQGQDPNPMRNAPALITAINPILEYEDRFLTQPPAGDFFAAAAPLWEEVSDFDHNT